MNYAKLKHTIPTHFFEVDNNLVGRSVYINNELAAISTVKINKEWFREMYERCEEKEFIIALEQAKKRLNVL